MTVTLADLRVGDRARVAGYSGTGPYVDQLIRLGLITQHPDPADARRKLFRLTEKGQAQMAMQDRYSEEISDVYRRLFEETGDVHAMILKVLRALKERPLRERTAPQSP